MTHILATRLLGRRLPRRLLGALAVFLLGATALVVHAAAPSNAAPGAAVVTGKGAWIAGHTDFVGYYRALVGGRWVKVYCVSPNRPAPTSVRLATVARVHGVSLVVSRELAATLAVHGDAKTDGQAEAVSQALNELIGNHTAVVRRAANLPRAVQALAMRYVAEARANHGPYTLTVRTPRSPLPGQTGQGSVTLRSANHGLSARVVLTHSANVSTPASVRTDQSGRATFTYRTTDMGEAHISASASVSPVTLRASAPNSTTQQMLSWSGFGSVRARASYRGSVSGFANRYACSTECDGQPLVTLAACAPASGYPSRITYMFDGHAHSVSFDAGNTRTCKSWTVRLNDRVTVTATWQYRTRTGWSRPVAAPGRFTVDCPPAPPVAVALSYDCTTAALSVALGTQRNGALLPLRNSSRHRMVLAVGGAETGWFQVAPGATATVHTYSIPCGTHTTVTVRGGVQRGSGGYNFGQTATVVTP
jgi:hypothetical protein